MRRQADHGERTIKYHHISRMLLGTACILLMLLGLWILLAIDPNLGYYLIMLGLLGSFVFFRFANLTIQRAAMTWLCWRGPFLPLWKRRGRFQDVRGLRLQLFAEKRATMGSKPERWILLLLRTGGHPILLAILSSFQEADRLARQMAYDLKTEVITDLDRAKAMQKDDRSGTKGTDVLPSIFGRSKRPFGG